MAGLRIAPDRAQIAWSTDDGLHVDGVSHLDLTCLHSPRGASDGDEVTGAQNGVEILVLEMPG
jgi:hypothetical protein